MNERKPQYPVSNIFINRWSSRAFSGEELTDIELNTLFEAARFAPSSYNNQPWRFIYAKKNTPHWQLFFNLLVAANQVWAANAAVLIVIASYTKFDYNGKPSRTHSFDTGAAWENLALQASLMDIIAHGMEGFNYEAAKKELAIPDDYSVQAMIALGKPGSIDALPEKLREFEKPNDRKKITTFVFEGSFKQ